MEINKFLTLKELKDTEFNNIDGEAELTDRELRKPINNRRVLEAQIKYFEDIEFTEEIDKDFKLYKKYLDFFGPLYPIIHKSMARTFFDNVLYPLKDTIAAVKYYMYVDPLSSDTLKNLSTALVKSDDAKDLLQRMTFAREFLYFKYYKEFPELIKQIEETEDSYMRKLYRKKMNSLLTNTFILLSSLEEAVKLYNEGLNLFFKVFGIKNSKNPRKIPENSFSKWVSDKDYEEKYNTKLYDYVYDFEDISVRKRDKNTDIKQTLIGDYLDKHLFF